MTGRGNTPPSQTLQLLGALLCSRRAGRPTQDSPSYSWGGRVSGQALEAAECRLQGPTQMPLGSVQMWGASHGKSSHPGSLPSLKATSSTLGPWGFAYRPNQTDWEDKEGAWGSQTQREGTWSPTSPEVGREVALSACPGCEDHREESPPA